jgi:2,4-dienoyl-CoA reductase-like NADH-dependent reductase (Old Yellow Enzyme family)/thioredoxin reductase
MLEHLFSPLRIKGVTLRNRIVATAHNTGLNDGLKIGDRLRAYYATRAEGGVGLMIMGSTSVHPSSNSRLRPAFANWSDDVIGEYAVLSEIVESRGARIFAQLNHAGAGAGVPGGVGHLLAPSAVKSELSPETPHELEPEQIAELVAAFAAAAVRVRAGRMHGLEIHAGHGNLIQQFLSALTNLRQDEYGGSLENRMRFGRMVLEAVRRAVGDDFIVGLRISVHEDHAGGLTLDDTSRIIPRFVQAGALDYVNITSGSDLTSWSLANHYASMYVRGQFLRPQASAIRKLISVPLLMSGRITDPRDADAIIAAGDADLVGMTRALIADRDLPNKARSGSLDTIRYCVGANDGCLGRLFRGLAITCIQDPTSGREHELGELTPAGAPRHVVVVGGGVAGMEAARVAALRGHRVTLIEQTHELGGQVQLARRAPGRAEIGAIIDNLSRALGRLPVEIRTGTEGSVDLLAAIGAELAIIATGSRSHLPHYADSELRLVSARGAIEGEMVGDSAIVFDSIGDHVGMMTADFLRESGRKVMFVTTCRVPGPGMDPMTGRMLYQRLIDGGVAFHTESKVARFTDEGVEIRHLVSGRTQLIRDVVTVVAACGGTADNQLYRALRRTLPDVDAVLVGDALAPRHIEQAIYEGHMAARGA